MGSGEYNRKVTFYKEVYTRGDFGETVTSNSSACSLWAKVRIKDGKEFWAAQQVNAELSGLITIRYTTQINPKMIMKYDSIPYEIISVIPKERHGKYWETELHVKEVSS